MSCDNSFLNVSSVHELLQCLLRVMANNLQLPKTLILKKKFATSQNLSLQPVRGHIWQFWDITRDYFILCLVEFFILELAIPWLVKPQLLYYFYATFNTG